jgi:RND superfamily putative drug exporter
VIDSGGPHAARRASIQHAVTRLARELRPNPAVAQVSAGRGPQYVSGSGRYREVVVAGHSGFGAEQTQRLVRQLRQELIPSAGFPAGARVFVGGQPAQGVDFLHRSYGYFPWLIGGVLPLTYIVLLRAFRSLVLPLKAVLLNLLSVAASYGMLVIVFRFGVGHSVAGLYQFPQVEGWIPIFMFAMLFGLSMDYEVFLVSRMRESWDEHADNERAVATGLERTGQIVTAAAIIMVAAFAGFVAGSVVGLQEFGLGLAVAVFVDATITRAILVPSFMAILGRWNWWLPRRVARLALIKPSPLAPARVTAEASRHVAP